jgi:REP element-mobilizing transposase RayT
VEMILSETGQIASKHWFDIPNHFPFIELINFVVMPNHIHGLLEIHGQNFTQTGFIIVGFEII